MEGFICILGHRLLLRASSKSLPFVVLESTPPRLENERGDGILGYTETLKPKPQQIMLKG